LTAHPIALSDKFMTPNVQIGTIVMSDRPQIAEFLGLAIEPYSGKWGIVQGFNGFALDRKIHAAGWNFFFMATKVKVMFFGSPETNKLQNAVRRILAKVRPQGFNCLEVTAIVTRRFLGIRYVTVSGHSRHIQPSCYLDGVTIRRASQQDAEWANG
jgi:hypothetical protein